MTFGHFVKCDKCGRTENVRTAHLYHDVVGVKQVIPSVALSSWCFECDAVCDCEQLPTTKRLSELLHELESQGIDEGELKDKAALLKIDVDPQQEYESKRAELQAAIRWRADRRSPPRCLACGGINHHPIEWSDRGCEHPGCGGTFRSELEYHGSQATWIKVDAEGHVLPDDEA